jgi:hypothetical protein
MPPRISRPPIVAPTATPAITPRDNPDFELGSDIELGSLLGEASVVLVVVSAVLVVVSVVLVVVSVVRVVNAVYAVTVFVSSAFGALTFTY